MNTLWYNPRCSKSRATLSLLEEKGATFEIRLYLKDTPSAAEVESVCKKLRKRPFEILRKKEYIDLGSPLCKNDSAYFQLLSEHPKLIERPIFITEKDARIGRPPKNIVEIL